MYKVDPTGLKVIAEAQEVRKLLRQMKKNGELTSKVHQAECERFRSHIRKLYFSDYPIQDDKFHPSIHMKV